MCELVSIIEGQFRNGRIDGFARVFDIQNQTCSIGFWKPDIPKVPEHLPPLLHLQSEPWGKWVQFDANGYFVTDNEFGIYMGRQRRHAGVGSHQIKYKCTKKKQVDSFCENEAPVVTWLAWLLELILAIFCFFTATYDSYNHK